MNPVGRKNIVSITPTQGTVEANSIQSNDLGLKPASNTTNTETSAKSLTALIATNLVPPIGEKIEPESLLLVANNVLNEWANRNGIPIELFREIELGELHGGAGGMYVTDRNQIILCKNYLSFHTNHLPTLLKFIPHEATHNYHAVIRTRLKMQHPEIFEETLFEHIAKLVEQGETSPIPKRLRLQNDYSGKEEAAFDYLYPPEMSLELRKKVTEKLSSMIKNPEKSYERSLSKVSLELKLKASERESIEALIEEEKDFIQQYLYHNNLPHEENTRLATEEGKRRLVEYVEAMFFRLFWTDYIAAIPDEQRVSVPTSPMTQEEIDKAKESLRGYFSTHEGNNLQEHAHKSQTYIPFQVKSIAYQCKAYEEREAQKNAATFELEEVEKIISSNSPENPNPELDRLIEKRECLKADVTLSDLYGELTFVLDESAKSPKDMSKLHTLNKMRTELEQCKKEIEEITKSSFFEGEDREHHRRLRDSLPFFTEMYTIEERFERHEVTDESEKKVFIRLRNLWARNAELGKDLDKFDNVINLVDSKIDTNQGLLSRYESIMDQIRELAPRGTNEVPSSFFKSSEEYWTYQKKVADQMGMKGIDWDLFLGSKNKSTNN